MLHYGEPWNCPPVWSVPDPCIAVTLPGGLELLAGGGSGSEFTLASWDGWTNGPEVRGGGVEWEHGDGGVPGDVHLSGRNLAFEGLIKGRSANHLWELQEELGSVLTRQRWGVLRVDEEHLGLSRQVEVARGGRPTITPLSRTVARYSVQLQSASPLKVDVDQQSATITTSGVTLSNKGNADAYPVVSLVGPLTNPAIVWPGGLWQYNLSVPAGTTLTVEMDRKRVRNLATTEHSRNNVSGSHNWLALPPGDTVVTRTGAGSGTITAKWRSAWY